MTEEIKTLEKLSTTEISDEEKKLKKKEKAARSNRQSIIFILGSIGGFLVVLSYFLTFQEQLLWSAIKRSGFFQGIDMFFETFLRTGLQFKLCMGILAGGLVAKIVYKNFFEPARKP